ncbi:hypothetical protein PBI_GAIA_151 [Mycobacterium phage Gaia]|uniref:Uncharacterized protein n=1 Tax=Mycobacterium phage Gaia TaxID=1486472 RepID=A0A068F1Z0_9CAUD|nr:HTH DNA binding protein [Mycobacterium phage Gaia]AID58967.1 hypothetical protein PBI_GAIA_151 [Mycobacterium phage Gaia]
MNTSKCQKCSRPAFVGGLCGKHYQLERRARQREQPPTPSPPALDLAAIREAARMSQLELGVSMGYKDGPGIASTINQLENRADIKLSTLEKYVRGAGGTAELVVQVNGKTLRFDIV